MWMIQDEWIYFTRRKKKEQHLKYFGQTKKHNTTDNEKPNQKGV